jgi:tripartite ATP-independent transporter DctM subunit
MWRRLAAALVPPLVLMVAVLGSIFAGIASPTEAAAVGALGALALTAMHKRLSVKTLRAVCGETAHLTSMVFMILVGATVFGLVFRGLGGDDAIIELVERAELSQGQFLLAVMVVVFIAGFFIDFIEITFIIVPVVAPIFAKMGVDLLWVGVLIAINLQTSFLTPPFGFSLFYLKGVAPPEVRTSHLYRGIIPFIVIQLVGLLLVVFFPKLATWLPEAMSAWQASARGGG